jgi:hypothetical protein
MGKQNGLACQLYVSGYDLGDDIQQFAVSCPTGLHDVTPITKSAFERIPGLRDGSMSATAFFNPATAPVDRAHKRFSALPRTDQLQTVFIGSALGFPAVSMLGEQLNYDGTRAADGMFTFAVQDMANGYGLEWGRQLTAGKRTDATATNGGSVDLGSASPGAFGLQAYLHVLAFTGTTATIKLQESSDNGVGDAWTDVVGGAFTAVTAGPTFQRLATGAINVERYLRVATTGTFSNLVFAAMVNRNPVATRF